MGIFDIFGTGDQQAAAQAQTAGITSGLNSLNTNFTQGQNALNTNYSAGLQPFLQNYSGAQAGTNMLGNALGLNGTQGSQQALQAFQQSNPGYAFQQQQGQNAVLANQAATGQLASGNTNLDLMNYSQGLANQSYGQWVQNLQPYLGASQSAATGIGTLDSGLGNQLNSSLQGQGNAAYGAATSIGNANANADLAGLTASGNILGLGAGILGLGTGMGGTVGGNAISGLGSSLYGAFLSDERAKDDIEPVGELFDGQTVYRYRYKGDERHQIGLIAQEVERAVPRAVVDLDGWKGVNYRDATNRAAGLANDNRYPFADGLLRFAA